MRRARPILAAVAVAATMAVPAYARAEEPASLEATTAVQGEPASTTSVPASSAAPIQRGDELVAPPSSSGSGSGSGGTSAGSAELEESEVEGGEPAEPAAPPPSPSQLFQIPSLPSSTCSASAVPPILVPIYQRAATAYGLGPHGPAILAGINEVETAFGTNLNVSSAGAEGWMQFMPSTWETWGVDANGDGVADPFNPEDAIYAAARYLNASGMPGDTYGAIYAYNHADWYVSEVLANAGCYSAIDGDGVSLTPQLQVFKCNPAPAWRDEIPAAYLSAFERAAGRYELGQRGVWVLAAVARLESNFGRGMDAAEMRESGPLGLEQVEWERYAVDGNEDGKIEHASPADSAATLARLIWSRGSLRAGVFTHNQAEWYVQEVLDQADQMQGGCEVRYVNWRVAPLPAELETAGPEATLSANGLASAPQSAPPAVKAAISAANSISTTPYIWSGGHGSWYASGYDCSGAVSFALYGAGLLDIPLTSGQLESYGEPGPGRWITIYASPTHTYAEIAGLRWDTVGDAHGTGPRWHTEPPYPAGFVVRHPAGY